MTGSAPPRILVVALTFLIACTAFAVDVSLPALPQMAQATGSTMPEVQRSIGIFIFGFAAGQLPMGMLADRFGRRPVLLGGMSLFVTFGVASSAADQINTLLLLRFFQGVAAASGAVLSRAVARDVTEGQATVRLMAFLASAMGIAMVVAPVVGSVALWALGWRGPLMASALWGGVGLVLCVLYVPETRPGGVGGSVSGALVRGVSAFMRTRAARYGALIAGLTFCGVMTLVTLSPHVLMGEQGLGPFGFAASFSVISAGYVAGALIARIWADALSADQLLHRMSIGFLIAAGLVMVAAQLAVLPVSVAAMAVMLGLLGANLGLCNAITMKPLGHVAGVAAACLGTLQLMTGAVFSAVMTVMDIDRMTELLGVFAVLAVLVAFAGFAYLRGVPRG